MTKKACGEKSEKVKEGKEKREEKRRKMALTRLFSFFYLRRVTNLTVSVGEYKKLMS
jgi:hypothetical protein